MNDEWVRIREEKAVTFLLIMLLQTSGYTQGKYEKKIDQERGKLRIYSIRVCLKYTRLFISR